MQQHTVELSSFTNYNTLKASFGNVHRRHVIKLGPSIIHLKDDMYLIAYRAWIKEDPNGKFPKAAGDIGHPWIHNWRQSLFNGTGICVVTIDENMGVKVLYDNISKGGQAKEDTRVFKTNDGSILSTFNTWNRLDPIKYKDAFNSQNKSLQQKCYHHVVNGKKKPYFPWVNFIKMYGNRAGESDNLMEKWYDYHNKFCAFMYSSVLKIGPSGQSFTSKKVICPSKQKMVEKNWAPFEVNGILYYQYAPDPWSFIKADSCTTINPKNSDFLERVRKRIGDYSNASMGKFKFLRFSNSTPLIPYKDNLYLGVGHYKIHYPNVDRLKPVQLKDFMNQIKKNLKTKNLTNLKRVPSNVHKVHRMTNIEESYDGLFYGWIFYTVNVTTFELGKCSDAYLPRSNKRVTISFPNGITKHHINNSYIVSYHESDASVMLKEIPMGDIDAMLVHTNTSNPNDFKFKFDLVKSTKVMKPTKLTKVSCILPTYNRERFMPHCMKLLKSQTFTTEFKKKYGDVTIELIVIDDSVQLYDQRIFPTNSEGNITTKYISLTKKVSIGEKRNIGVQNSTGDIIIHWDDDDYYSNHRIMSQIQPILAGKYDMTVYTNFAIMDACKIEFYRAVSKKALHQRFYNGIQGGTLCYRRSIFSERVKYPHISMAEDIRFMMQAIKMLKASVKILNAKDYYVYVRYDNTYLFNINSLWKRVKFKMIRSSRIFYDMLCQENMKRITNN